MLFMPCDVIHACCVLVKYGSCAYCFREKESSKAAGCRVTIPLGKKAVNCVPLYDTTYHDEFKARSVDVIQQRASAELMRSLNHAPTATVGCVTRSH